MRGCAAERVKSRIPRHRHGRFLARMTVSWNAGFKSLMLYGTASGATNSSPVSRQIRRPARLCTAPRYGTVPCRGGPAAASKNLQLTACVVDENSVALGSIRQSEVPVGGQLAAGRRAERAPLHQDDEEDEHLQLAELHAGTPLSLIHISEPTRPY